MEELSDEALRESVEILIEEIELSKDIKSILGEKQNINKRDIPLLLSLKNKYHSSLAQKHIEYYTNKYKAFIIERIKKTVSLIIIMIMFFIMIVVSYKIHNNNDVFSNSDNTLISAIEDYNNGTIPLCSNKITFLLNHDWDGFIVYEYYMRSAERMIDYYENAGTSIYFNKSRFLFQVRRGCKQENVSPSSLHFGCVCRLQTFMRNAACGGARLSTNSGKV